MSNKSRIKKEKYPLPEDVDGILALVRSILDAGSVQRLELDVNGPVRVFREVEIDDQDLTEPDIDLDGALRNVNMVEYASEGAECFQVIVDMMMLAQSKGLHCTCWAVGTGDPEPLLPKWLDLENRGMPLVVDGLVGLPVHILRSLPEDTLILCASNVRDADASEITFTVKTDIEIRSEDEDHQHKREPENHVYTLPGSQADDPVGVSPRGSPPSAGELALAATGLSTVEFKRSGDSGD